MKKRKEKHYLALEESLELSKGSLYRVKTRHGLITRGRIPGSIRVRKDLKILMYLETTCEEKGIEYHWFLDLDGKKICCIVYGKDKKWFFHHKLEKAST